MVLVRVAEGRQPSVLVELEVVEQQDTLAVEDRLVGAADDQRAVEAALELLGLVDVRVVPERPGVRHDESVLERSARFNRWLHRLRSVHIRGDTEPVPVNRGRLRQAVCQSHLDGVANLGFDQRFRQGCSACFFEDRHQVDLGHAAREHVDNAHLTQLRPPFGGEPRARGLRRTLLLQQLAHGAREQLLVGGRLESHDRGKPSTRSATMLRWISFVPA